MFIVSEAKNLEHTKCVVSIIDTEIDESDIVAIVVIVSKAKKLEQTEFVTSDTDTEINKVSRNDHNNCCVQTVLESKDISSKESDGYSSVLTPWFCYV